MVANGCSSSKLHLCRFRALLKGTLSFLNSGNKLLNLGCVSIPETTVGVRRAEWRPGSHDPPKFSPIKSHMLRIKTGEGQEGPQRKSRCSYQKKCGRCWTENTESKQKDWRSLSRNQQSREGNWSPGADKTFQGYLERGWGEQCPEDSHILRMSRGRGDCKGGEGGAGRLKTNGDIYP